MSTATRCRGCGHIITFVHTAAGKMSPTNADGTSHFTTCPQAREFHRNTKHERTPEPETPAQRRLRET